jgi:capsular polysaccharide biosynthesis protein
MLSHRSNNRITAFVLVKLRKRLLLDLGKIEVGSYIATLKRIRFSYQPEKSEKSLSAILRSSRVMLQTRGLTRCLVHNFLPQEKLENPNFLTCSRFDLIKNISTRPRSFYSNILQKITFTNEFTDSEYLLIEKDNFFNHENLNRFIPNQVYEFALDWSNEKTHHNLLQRIQSNQNSFLSTLITWDLSRTRQIVSLLGIEKQFYAFLYLHNASLAKHMRRVRVLEIHPMKNSSETFDTLMQQKQDHFVLIQHLEIWHNRILVQDSKLLVTDITASPNQEFVSGLWQFAKAIKGTNHCDVLGPSMGQKTLESGIVIIGRVDTNWFHFLLDTVPRVLFATHIPEEIPLVVRGDVPESGKLILESLTQREIIYLQDSENIVLKTAYIMPARGAIFDSKPKNYIPRLEYSFNTYKLLAEEIKLKMYRREVPGYDFPIAVLRRNSNRAITNQLEIAEVLNYYDVMTLEADDYFFTKQIKIFSEITMFIGAGGAVVSNIIFMEGSSAVVVLENKSSAKLGIWKELAIGMGLQYDSVIGKSFRGSNFFRDRLHSDFKIDIAELSKVLEKKLKGK